SLPVVPDDPAAVEAAVAASIGRPLDRVTMTPLPPLGWFLTARCPHALTRHGLSRRLTIDPRPLAAELRTADGPLLPFYLSHPAEGYSEFGGSPVPRPGPDYLAYQGVVSADDPPESLVLTFGYRLSALWPLALLPVLLVAPVAFTLRQRAANVREPDPAV